MLGEISWALVCFAVGWFCRGQFGSIGEMWRWGKAKWDGASKP